jgi:integrase/recombinase XerD
MKRRTHEPTPDFWGYARNFLHDFLPNQGNGAAQH